jgi:hypothetical protein
MSAHFYNVTQNWGVNKVLNFNSEIDYRHLWLDSILLRQSAELAISELELSADFNTLGRDVLNQNKTKSPTTSNEEFLRRAI